MLYVRMLPADKKLRIYKMVKGFCLWEGVSLVDTMKDVLNSKAKDVVDLLYLDAVNYFTIYKEYSYGRY